MDKIRVTGGSEGGRRQKGFGLFEFESACLIAPETLHCREAPAFARQPAEFMDVRWKWPSDALQIGPLRCTLPYSSGRCRALLRCDVQCGEAAKRRNLTMQGRERATETCRWSHIRPLQPNALLHGCDASSARAHGSFGGRPGGLASCFLTSDDGIKKPHRQPDRITIMQRG